METVAEKERQQAGALEGARHYDHELVHELSKRLDTLWRYGECLANAEGDPEMQKTWRELKLQEQVKINELKHLITSCIEKGEFLEDL